MVISGFPYLDRRRVAMTIPSSLIWRQGGEVRATSLSLYGKEVSGHNHTLLLVGREVDEVMATFLLHSCGSSWKG